MTAAPSKPALTESGTVKDGDARRCTPPISAVSADLSSDQTRWKSKAELVQTAWEVSERTLRGFIALEDLYLRSGFSMKCIAAHDILAMIFEFRFGELPRRGVRCDCSGRVKILDGYVCGDGWIMTEVEHKKSLMDQGMTEQEYIHSRKFRGVYS